MNNIIIGLGNTGTNIIKAAADSTLLKDVTMYAIDSVTTSVDLNLVNRVNIIPIISDEKSGSGRNRERGKAMYKFHEENGAFETMYNDAANSKAPVIVVTSAAGGTGSGSIVPLCEALILKDIQVIPIIVCPNMDDPIAYHLNTSDLMMELSDIGIETYSIFKNAKDNADYAPINQEIVELIEIIFGKKYDKTDLDSIDDSDLGVILETPGRFIAVSVKSNRVDTMGKELVRKIFSGFQPGWTEEDTEKHTFMKAYSLKSMFAKTDFKKVFEEINSRIVNSYDEYRNICCSDNNGECNATIIIAGLPRAELKIIDTDFKETKGIADGVSIKSTRPKFMSRKKASITSPSNTGDGSAINKFNWK